MIQKVTRPNSSGWWKAEINRSMKKYMLLLVVFSHQVSLAQDNKNEVNVVKEQIQIKGSNCSISSINTNSEPMYVIDGVISTKEVFSVLNPNSIESISILKDSSTTSIFCCRTNRVIIVKTKDGFTKKEQRKTKK